MNIFAKSLATAGLATAALAATPVAAQVNGIATSSPEAVIVRSAARQAAYTQIQQTYATQIQQATALRQEINNLQRSLDTNNDNQLTDAEIQANQPVVQQIQQKEQQVNQITQPIALAQTYAIEQLVDDYDNARNQVIQQKKIQILLAPDAIQYGPDSMNVTSDIVAALDKRMPTVQTQPPANWQPRRDSAQLHQAVQQILVGVAQQQAYQAAQQQQQQQQAAQPQQQQPTGR